MPSRTSAYVALVLALIAIPTTLAQAHLLRTAHASIDRQTILLHGKPFFPVMLIDQCDPGASARARSLGINLILNEACAGVSSRRQLARVTPGSFAVLPIKGQGVQGNRFVGWTYPDEPDNNGWTAARLARSFPYRSGTPDGLISFMTTSGRFYQPLSGASTEPAGVFRTLIELPDVAGFDLYPLNHCDQDLSSVADAQRQFAALAGGKPTFQWIETGPIKPSYCGGFQMTPQQLGAETWLAVIGGARGIGFFTHTWTPKHAAFDVSPAIRQAIRATAVSLRELSPGLTGTTVASSVDSGAIQVLARDSGTRTYVFAVNTLSSPVKAQLNVPSLENGAARLYGEPRSVPVSNGMFVDTFPALGIHIYVQRH